MEPRVEILIIKRDELREMWLREKDPSRKRVIAAQGKALNIAIELSKKDKFAAQVIETIF